MNTDVTISNNESDVASTQITYENMPVYHDPYGSRFYHSLYDDDFQFEELTIKFSVSSSTNYEKAVFIIRCFPRYHLGDAIDGPHSFTINTYAEFYTYQKAIDTLVYLISGWKSTQIYINRELVSDRDFRDMSWLLTKRLRHCPVFLPPLVSFDVSQEYWDTYKKILIESPKRRRTRNGKIKE